MSRRPVRLEDLGRCLVCRKKLAWPAIHFCGRGCSEVWPRRVRGREGAVGAPPPKEASP